MEALRVRAIAHRDTVDLEGGEFLLEDFELGYATPAVEVGTLNSAAAFLMQAGFTSRLAAIQAALDTNANFSTLGQLREWAASEEVEELTHRGDWPSPETADQWREFVDGLEPRTTSIWSEQAGTLDVVWNSEEAIPEEGTPVRLHFPAGSEAMVLSEKADDLGRLDFQRASSPAGIFIAQVGAEPDSVDYRYLGPRDFEVG